MWDLTRPPCIGRWILNHWTIRKAPTASFLLNFLELSVAMSLEMQTSPSWGYYNQFSHLYRLKVFPVFGVSIILLCRSLLDEHFLVRLWRVPRGGVAGGREEPLPALVTLPMVSCVDQPKGFSDFFQIRRKFNPRSPYCEPRLSLKLKLHKDNGTEFGSL